MHTTMNYIKELLNSDVKETSKENNRLVEILTSCRKSERNDKTKGTVNQNYAHHTIIKN